METSNQIRLINEVVLVDCQRINQRFKEEAMVEWDRVGRGCFKVWLQVMIFQKWLELVRSN